MKPAASARIERGLDPKSPPGRALGLYAKGVNECARLGLPLPSLRVEWVGGVSCWRFDGAHWRGAFRLVPFPFRLCRWLDIGPRKAASLWQAQAGGIPNEEFFCQSASRAYVEFETTQDANFFSLPHCLTVLVPRAKYPIEALQMAFARRQAKKAEAR